MSTTRFYDRFQPRHYDLKIAVDRKSKQIQGHTVITGEAQTPEIDLHQKGLKLTSLTANGQEVPFTVDDASQSIHLTLPASGDVTLAIDYHTALTDSMMGIYPSYYQVNGQQKELVGTQFETTFARQAFPGIDEPAAKATFSLALKFDEQPGETVIANMPEDHVADGYHYFKETVKMSTYLVAFAFGDLQKKVTQTKSGVQVGVFATKAHRPAELDFALDIAKRSIEFYEDFYQTPYPLPHSWQLALPDFSAGAMENWGLVTYREAYLLVDPQNTSLDRKRLVATVIAHELAHQWFGDLVTMQWWDDLWLNESFANMMEYLAVDALEPDWHVWDLFQTTDVPMALQRDATAGVQPIHVAVNDPAEIDALFDGAIVYAKGSRMLVMVRSLIGDENLRAGLRDYFAAHQYANATGDDLWQALSTASGIDLGALMHSWLDQPGYPVVKAQVVDGRLKLTQRQFFIGQPDDQGRQWELPLGANYGGVPKLMTGATLDLGDYQTLRDEYGQPFRLNQGNSAHFIVDYDETLLADLLATADQLTPIDQRELIQDRYLLARARQIDYASLIPLLTRFAHEKAVVVTAILYQVANSLKDFVTPGSQLEAQLRKFFNHLSQDQITRLGWEPDPADNLDDQLTRPLVLNAGLYAHNEAAQAAAHQLFDQHQVDLAALPADVRPVVLKNEVANYGQPALVDQLLQAYQLTADPSYKLDLSHALTAASDPAILTELIAKFKDASVIKPQDLRGWYRGILANPHGQQLAWDWLRDQWDWLEATVGGDMEFATFITVTAQLFHTPTRLREFKAFFDPKLTVPGLTREIKMDTELIAGQVDLVEHEANAVNAAIARAI